MESVKGKSIEQQIRDILERMGVVNAQEFTSGDLVELANILSDKIALEKRCEEAEKVKQTFIKAEHALSDAYIRLRGKLKAMDTPYAPTAEEVWRHTERKLDELIAGRDELLQKVRGLSQRITDLGGDAEWRENFMSQDKLTHTEVHDVDEVIALMQAKGIGIKHILKRELDLGPASYWILEVEGMLREIGISFNVTIQPKRRKRWWR